jgi:predicted metal-binding membrane protein
MALFTDLGQGRLELTGAKISLVERVARNERAVILASVAAIVALAGAYTVLGVGMDMSAIDMTSMARRIGSPMQMDMVTDWTFSFAALICLMWWIMMITMMTPTAAPTLFLFSALRRHGDHAQSASLDTGKFLAGYLLAWAGFSVVAAGAQWASQMSGLVSAQMMTINSQLFAGVILVAAGGYQFSSLKNSCLKHCRSPAQFLTDHRRSGAFGPWIMGAHHGTYCVGCCWALMALLFVGGIMNLYWIVGLALYVLLEKWIPYGNLVSRIAGFGLIVFGLSVAYSTLSFPS